MNRIFIPREEKSTKEYVRYTTITTFVSFMLYACGYFYEEYNLAETNKKVAAAKIEEIKDLNLKLEQNQQREIIRDRNKSIKPSPSPSPNKPKHVEKNIVEEPKIKDSKIEIDAILVKVAMSNEASWNAILKMIATVLGTFFGIKLINLLFRKLEADPKPA